ncbi:type II toxin-antitoxin system CcdA family antitoxin [Sphingomonas floccifaciens]|uniref:Type II toxin-antitoxin system CcdA family antitoxin n=1 Tax=Sphingomonas floccifaciens TaxID=1844115 RepID=A0ABW4NB08_9SPHN
MKHESIRSGKRKAVNLSIDSGIVSAAREAEINLSQVCEAAIRTATEAEQARRWKEENRAAFAYWNKWVEDNGLPLVKYRLF